MSDDDLSRRKVLLGGLGAAAAAVLAGCARNGDDDTSSAATRSAPSTTAAGAPATTAAAAGSGAGTTLAPTPECRDDDDVTPAQTEGPYFKADSPERTDIRDGTSGTRLLLAGAVVTTDCRPVDRALVDFWQCDAGGTYDNSGFRFRGHQFTDAQGRYQLDTVVPGLYPGRTRHIHVKVQRPGGRVLTTQLYFPGEAANASDRIYREECEIDVREGAGGKDGAFTFVLDG